jgi:hypothetical protein
MNLALAIADELVRRYRRRKRDGYRWWGNWVTHPLKSFIGWRQDVQFWSDVLYIQQTFAESNARRSLRRAESPSD